MRKTAPASPRSTRQAAQHTVCITQSRVRLTGQNGIQQTHDDVPAIAVLGSRSDTGTTVSGHRAHSDGQQTPTSLPSLQLWCYKTSARPRHVLAGVTLTHPHCCARVLSSSDARRQTVHGGAPVLLSGVTAPGKHGRCGPILGVPRASYTSHEVVNHPVHNDLENSVAFASISAFAPTVVCAAIAIIIACAQVRGTN